MPRYSDDSTQSPRGNKLITYLICTAALIVLGVVGFFSTYTFKVVEGNEIGVRETWSGGVDPNPLPPKTYMYNRWTEAIYVYPTSGQVFVMNDKPPSEERQSMGRPVDPLVVNSSDNQKISFHTILTWRISPLHVVNLHKNYRADIEEKLIRPQEIKEVVSRATVEKAIDLYSGAKLNDLRSGVEGALINPEGKLAQEGVAVDSFIVEKPELLNKDYVAQIEARQVAIITESRAQEQKKANDALAEAAKSAAQKEANERIVKAKADKEVAILGQEATAQQAILQVDADAKNNVTRQTAESAKVVLAAKAEAERQVAISEASKQAEINRAVGIRAVGEAEANRNQLLLNSYAVAGADNYTKIKIAEQFAQGLGNVKFFPANATFNTIANDFDKGLSLLVGSGTPATAAVTK